MNLPEVITIDVKPIDKLIDAVSGAIGKAYEPRHIRKMADAKAYEIEVVSEKIRNNADLPIVYDASGNCSIDSSDYESLAKRTGKRIAYQEMIKQENIEKIVDAAYDSLKDIHEIGEGEISREWMNRFINSAGDITTEELQLIWSKVLAGEVKNPTSFSLRTLECLRNLDVDDAKLFEKVCKLVIMNCSVINDDQILNNNGIKYSDILRLDDCGLINCSPAITWNKSVTQKGCIVIDFDDYIFCAKSEKDTELIICQFPLTIAGRELYSIIGRKMKFEIVKDICSTINEKHKNIEWMLYKVNGRDENGINYDENQIVFNKD